jgi:hypothetical protein
MFYIAAPPGNPEIWWMRPVKGYVTGGEEIGIIGKKFLKGKLVIEINVIELC